MKINISAETFNKIMNMGKYIASKDTARKALQAIHIVCDESGVCRAEACDGFMASTIKFRSFDGFEPGECMLMPQACRKYGKRENPTITIESDGENVTFSDYNGSLTAKEIKGDYIDLQRVYPTKEPAATVYLNPELLQNVLKACKGETLIKLEIRRDIDPVRIATSDFNMLCLPVRADKREW